MAKKSPVKKEPAKKAPAKKAAPSGRKAAPSGGKAAAAADIAATAVVDDGIDQQRIDLLPPSLVADTKESLRSVMEDFRDVTQNYLNAIQRRRKIGAGIRNYGFIEKVADLAEANPQFAQFFRPVDLRNAIRNFDDCRDIALLLQAFTRLVTNTMLVYSNEAFGMLLIFYNMLKEMSRRGSPTAMELFRTLQPFFRRPGRASAEPTEKELERDLHALLHGTKEGKIVVENTAPVKSAGARKVIDDVHKGHTALKEGVDIDIQEK